MHAHSSYVRPSCNTSCWGGAAARTVLLLAALLATALAQGALAQGNCPLSATDGSFEVATRADLAAIGQGCPLDGDYHLTQDVDLSASDWVPIGWAPSEPDVEAFTGTLDGRSRTIEHLRIVGGVSQTDVIARAGLFARLDGARVERLVFDNVAISATDATTGVAGVGVVAGEVTGSTTQLDSVRVGPADVVRNDVDAGSVTDVTGLGGLIGVAAGDLEVTGTPEGPTSVVVDLTGNAARGVGGVVGMVDGANVSLEGVGFLGQVDAVAQVGGLVGTVGTPTGSGTLTTSVATAAANVFGDADVGGAVGRVDGTVTIEEVQVRNEETVATGRTVDTVDAVGGVIGRVASGSVVTLTSIDVGPSDAIRDADPNGLYAVSGTDFVGGAVGVVSAADVTMNDVRIENRLDVRGADHVGGVVGMAVGASTLDADGLTVSATVSATDNYVGGVIGELGIIGDSSTSATHNLRDVTTHADTTVRGVDNVGGIIGNVDDGVTLDLDGIATGGTVYGEDYVGGIAGEIDDASTLSLSNAEARTHVRANGNDLDYFGGVIGKIDEGASAELERVRVRGPSVIGSEGAQTPGKVGGVVGDVDKGSVRIADTSVASDVTVRGDFNVGGVIGHVNDSGSAQAATVSLTDVRVDATTEGIGQVGGVIGDLQGTAVGLRIAVGADATIQGERKVGGIVGWANQNDDAPEPRPFTDVLMAGTVEVLDTSTGAPDQQGGVVGNARNHGIDVRRTLVVGSADLNAGRTSGALAGTITATTVTATDTFWDATVLGDVPAVVTTSATGALAGNARSEPTATLRTFALYDDAGWSIANGRPAAQGPDDATWTLCRGETPTLTRWAPSTCAPAGSDATTVHVGGFAPDQLRNIPFDVTVSLTDADGNPAFVDTPTPVTLSATGGATSGRLLTYADDATTPVAPTATLEPGSASVTLDDVFHTGLSSDGTRDVTLTVVDGPLATLDVSTSDLALRDIAMTANLAPDRILLGGRATVTVTLTDAEGTALPDQPITLDTTLGRFVGDDGEATATTVLRTDDDGRVRTTLRASGEAGVATVTARCPGLCPTTADVRIVGETEALRVVPGNREAWLYFVPPADTTNVRYRIDGGPWIAADPPRTRGPVHVTPETANVDLRNGTDYTVELQGIASGDDAPTPSIAGPVTFTPRVVERPAVTWSARDGADPTATVEDGRLRVTLTATFANEGTTPRREVWVAPPDGDAWTLDGVAIPDDATRDTYGPVVQREAAGWRIRFLDAPLAPGDTLDVSLDLLERTTP